jgi:hypothetical protein
MKVGSLLVVALVPFFGSCIQSGANSQAASSNPLASPASSKSVSSCSVTVPNGKFPVGYESGAMLSNHGNDDGTLFTWLWEDGEVAFQPGGPGQISRAGLSMKWPWVRAMDVQGLLIIVGRRLDAPAPPLRADIPGGNAFYGFTPTALIFPTVGCWEVTGRVGASSLTFVTLVERQD